MVYNSSGNNQYLKSQCCEIGHFSCILGFFPDFPDFFAAKRGAEPIELALKASDFQHQVALLNFHSSFNLNVLKLINYSFYLKNCMLVFLIEIFVLINYYSLIVGDFIS